MSKPNFRIDLSREQTELLFELLSRAMCPPQNAQSIAGLWSQIGKAMKHHGVQAPAPIVPPPSNTAA